MAPTKVLILGATGPTGQEAVKQAVENGFIVTVYARRILSDHANNPDIKAIKGELNDEASLRTAIQGQDAVVSMLGPSGLRVPVGVFGDAYRRIFKIMREEKVKRIVALTTFSVHDPKDKFSLAHSLSVWMVWLIANNAWKEVVDIGNTFDKDAADLDWTLFRVGFLLNGTKKRTSTGYISDGNLKMSVNRADIANWALAQAASEPATHVHEKPGIYTAN